MIALAVGLAAARVATTPNDVSQSSVRVVRAQNHGDLHPIISGGRPSPARETPIADVVPAGAYARIRDKTQVLAGVIRLIKVICGNCKEPIPPTTVFGRGGLEFDELDHVELIMSIEEAFDFEISDEAAASIRTVGDAVDFVARTPPSSRSGK